MGVDFFDDPRLQPLVTPTEQLSVEMCLELMSVIATFATIDCEAWIWEMFGDIIGGRPLDRALVFAETVTGGILLHFLAATYSIDVWGDGADSSYFDPMLLSPTASLIAECISLGADLSPQGGATAYDLDRLTPLAVLVERRVAEYYPDEELEFDLLLQAWSRMLAACGADLMAYGASETATRCTYRNWTGRPKILGFTYGPQPADWHFLFPVKREHYIGQFWRMVEEPQLDIPGAWIE